MHTERGALKDTLDGLVTKLAAVQRLHTETASRVGAAFLVPVLIWIIQRLLERLGV